MPTLKERLKRLDERLSRAARPIGVLRHLNWEPSIRQKFLEELKKGNPSPPIVSYTPVDYQQNEVELRSIVKEADEPHPAFQFLVRSAQSYLSTIEMMKSVGTSTFCKLSQEIYGHPGEMVHTGGPSYLDGAQLFVEMSKEFQDSCSLPETLVCITPKSLCEDLEASWKHTFPGLELNFELDDSLLSKAAAGAKRVRIRTSTCFSEGDVDQLLQHEAFVHSLTALNGKSQPLLKSMGLGAPRTTRTQEGIALFAEFITGVMDLSRLRRIALRVEGVKMGIDGANFLEVFEFFRSGGQSETEAFDSAARVFRGGSVEGGNVFTKDCTYLAGLTDVHTFLRKSIQSHKLDYPHFLFSGRLTLGDVIELEECFEQGVVARPEYEPEWVSKRSNLSAFLLYSGFLNSISLGDIELSDFRNPSC